MINKMEYTVEDDNLKVYLKTKDSTQAYDLFSILKKNIVNGKTEIKTLYVYCIEYIDNISDTVKVQVRCFKR